MEALNRYEKHSLAGKRKIKPSLCYEMAQKKISSCPQSSETKTKQKNSTNPNKNSTNPINQTFMKLIHSINATFLSLKTIVDTMSGMQKIKTSLLKISNKLNKHITLLSDANVPVRFRTQQRLSKVKLTIPHS